MKKIDFLNQPPKFSIFNNASNKTFFGGVLFIFDLIAMLAVTFIFFYNHKSLENYEIEYIYNFESGNSIHLTEKDERFDSKLNFSFDVTNDAGQSRTNNFVVRYLEYSGAEDGPEINRKEKIIKKPSQIRVGIFFKCENKSYCKPDQSTRRDDFTTHHYNLKISYDEFYMDLQGDIPLYKIDYNDYYSPFLVETPTKTILHWSNIKVTDEIGMWSRFFFYTLGGNKLDSYTAGYIDSSKTFPIEVDNPYKIYRNEKLLGVVEIENNPRTYVEYRRKSKSIWSTIANIASLISTINFCFASFYSFYATKFDNYQIIKYVEYKIGKKNNLIKNNINNNNIVLKDINKPNNENETDGNKIPLVNTENNDDNNNGEFQVGTLREDIEKIVGDNNYDNKINFIDFLLNNIYCKSCKRKKKQDMINICNEIVAKYLSVENIIYNQIMMEKLWKDYKWNDPIHNKIIDNDFTLNLKEYLK